jgi:hypothetical protein
MLTSLNVVIITDGHTSDDSVLAQSFRTVGLQLYGHLLVRRENYSSTIDSRRSDRVGHFSVLLYLKHYLLPSATVCYFCVGGTCDGIQACSDKR